MIVTNLQTIQVSSSSPVAFMPKRLSRYRWCDCRLLTLTTKLSMAAFDSATASAIFPSHSALTTEDVFNRATQPIRIFDVVEISLDLALLCQRLESPLNPFEFPKDAYLSNDSRLWRFLAHCSKFCLLSPSLKSPSEMDVQSEVERALTLSASDSIVRLFALVCWNAH